MNATKCTSPYCGNATRDSSGRCHHHRSLRTPGASAGTRTPGAVPPSATLQPSVEEVEFGLLDEPHPTGGYDEVRKMSKGLIAYMQGGKYHREDGPAIIKEGGSEWAYMVNGKYHREDGPATRSTYRGVPTYDWFVNGKQHRDDGPSSIRGEGMEQEWHKDGSLHRTDGPAKTYPDPGHSGRGPAPLMRDYYLEGSCIPTVAAEESLAKHGTVEWWNFSDEAVAELKGAGVEPARARELKNSGISSAPGIVAVSQGGVPHEWGAAMPGEEQPDVGSQTGKQAALPSHIRR